MTVQKNNAIKILIILLVLASAVLRFISIPNSNQDMVVYNLRWYEELSQKGIGKTLGTNFSNYAPPYTYLLAIATFTRGLIPPLTAIKLIPIGFDLLGAYFIYKIVKLKYQQGYFPKLAAAIYFAAPTVILNSAYWGQADSIYTSALLICLYLLMTDRPLLSMLTFGAAFSVKAQAVFLLPLLGVMALRKKIHWLYFGAIPLVYLIAILPVVILGRPFMDALLVYAKQSDTFNALSMNAPNVYGLFQREWYAAILPFGLALTVLLALGWVYTTWQAKAQLDNKTIILLAFISAALIPFLLPKMHDRYFYPADVLSILLAFYWPSLWFMPILLQLGSGGAIAVFLFNADSAFTIYGFLINTIALGIALHTQRTVEQRKATSPIIAKSLAWLTTIFVPFALFGIGFNFLLTPAFLRVEYALPHITTNELNKSEQFQWASQTVEYLSNDRKPQFLQKLRVDNGAPVFSDREVGMVEYVKRSTQSVMSIWQLALAFSFIFSISAWSGGWLPTLRDGVRRGGWLALGIAILIAAVALISAANPFEGTDMLLRLFPAALWRDALLVLSLCMGAGGFLLTRANFLSRR